MRSLLLIAAVLVTGALALKAGQQCEPGSTFKMDCNTCFCSVDGKIMSCTRKFCIPEEQGDDPKVAAAAAEEASNGQEDLPAEKEEEHVHTNGQVCTPNEVKMEDCNRCKCAANGIGWFCTRKACPPREKRSVDAVQPAAPQCTPGTSFKSADGCNDCVCGPTGIAACTMKFCFFEEPATKTKRDVSQQQPAKNECVPGSSFKSADGCNDCFCTENGIAACTMKFCYFDQPATKTKREAEQQCEPGTNFKSADGCNECFCTETGVAACTAKFCFANPRTRRQVAKAECEPGTSFKSADGCNDCVCGPTGIAACTFKFCFFEEPVANRQKREAEEKCVPGTTFMDKEGCNQCFCTETGHAACTEKLCLDNPRSKRSPDNEELPQSELAPGTPGFSCNPGKSFKYQCNTCRCDTSGQSAACTFKFCLPGEY